VVHAVVQPGLLHDIDLGAIPAVVAHGLDARTGDPERRPVARLFWSRMRAT